MTYHFTKDLEGSFDDVIDTITNALKEEGFGIISTVDMKAAFKNKLNEEFKEYTILGACSPKHALKALSTEATSGVYLPCNVVDYENDKGSITVSTVNPKIVARELDDPTMVFLMEDITNRLARVMDQF